MMQFLSVAAILATAFTSSAHERAFAYIDPGAGSMILQILVGAILGVLVFFRVWWRWLRTLFAGKKKPDKDDDPSCG